MNRSDLKSARRIVVKVGTALLTGTGNRVSTAKIRRIAEQVSAVKKTGRQVVLVSSGAVGLGLGIMGARTYPKTISERQALAAIGQSRLMHLYESYFRPHRIKIGQVVLTGDDLHVRQRYLNIRNTFLKLLDLGAVPIVNENDTVSVEEVKFGDNDTLSANVALVTESDALIILTDIDGLHDKDPRKSKNAVRLSTVSKIDSKIIGLAQGTQNVTAIGGMETKVRAAQIASQSGIPTLVTSGLGVRPLEAVLAGNDVGSFFVPSRRRLSQKEKWIAHSRRKKGGIVIDDGCRLAVLKKGKSILPVGVKKVWGGFKRGDAIVVKDARGRALGTGISNYEAAEFKNVIGKKFKDEIIHRDNLVLQS